MSDLLRDAKFWTAIIALLNAIVFYVDPQFPEEIWAAIDALLAVAVGYLATHGAVVAARARRALRQ